MRLIFIRHGHPDYATDSLTPLGHLHAKAAADRLAGEGIDAIFASPLGRAQQTAAHTADRLGLPVTTLPFMRELDWGGTAYNPWLRSRDRAREGVDLIHADEATLPGVAGGRLLEAARGATDGLDAWLAGLGYTREGLYYRCAADEAALDRRTVAIFSHAGSGSAVIAHLLAMPLIYFTRTFDLNYTAICDVVLDARPGEIVLPHAECINDFRHIRGVGVSSSDGR